MRRLIRKCAPERQLEAELPKPQYDELVDYCEFVSIVCLESALREQKAEHRPIDEE